METQSIEFKPSWRDEYLKVISAFANSDGGELIIGVDDNGKPVGVKNAKKLLEDIPNKVRNKLGIIPSVNIEERRNKEVVKVVIKPSSVPISYDGKYYIRSGSTTPELKGKKLADFLLKKFGKTWDEVVEGKAEFDDLNSETIVKFKKLAVDRIPSIAEEKDWKTVLEKLNLVEDSNLKRAAILLFGNNPQRFYIQSCVKIGKFLTETDIQTTDIVEGNLFEQLKNTLAILRAKYLKSNISYEGIHRRDILEYPYDALREAVINALIHRDYLGTSNIQIRVYDDKLIIMNEGELPPEVPVEKLKTEHLSKPRNNLLAKVFYFAGFIESWGRGTIKIVENCVKQGLPAPDFIEESGVMKVIFYKDKFTEEFLQKMGLNERQIKAVMYVKAKGKITNKEYQKVANVKERLSTIELNDLVSKKILQKFGTTGRGTYYAALKAQKPQGRRTKGAKEDIGDE